MEKSSELKPGDKVYHKSLTNVIWVIDKIENGEAYCSTLNKETLEKKTQSFALTSIEKVNDKRPTGLKSL